MATTNSSESSMTSTSHTLTAAPLLDLSRHSQAQQPAMADLLNALVPANQHTFLTPSSAMADASLTMVARIVQDFAGRLSDEQAERLKEKRRKRKRGEDEGVEQEILRVKRVHTEGFEVGQIWEQVRRVVDALKNDAERAVGELERAGARRGEVDLSASGADQFETGSGDEGMDEDEEEEEENSELEAGEDDEELELDGESGEHGSDVDELLHALEGDDDLESLGEDEEDTFIEEEENPGILVEDPHGLNDGFFSIDDFNKQTEFLERQDAAADPYTGEASDEEDIDWDADPMSVAQKPTSDSRRSAAMDVESEEAEDDEEEEEEDGPTFGNMDLNAPEGDSDDEDGPDAEEDVDTKGDNTNEILYKDFFEPPPRKASKGERQADYLARQARKAKPEEDEATMERAISDVRRDLFDDESDHDDSEDALSDLDPADPKSRRSAHERKQAKIIEEIRRLEAASVAKRQWTLSGEARAADRPKNSLLEEQLDYEHTGKPVPEITAEISESIEELIKRRILAQDFDEVIRRRPDALSTPANTRRGAFELDDTKPKQSLAEMYEEEHVKAHNPDTYVSKADEKLRKEEKEIETLWKDVSAKLDALSSWHYKPKPAAPSLTIVADVPTVSMEDAQPGTAMGVSGGESMLAPQEVYKAGKDKENVEKDEVVPKSGAPVARQEMTREEKLRRRRREKERIRKRGGEEINQRPQSKKAIKQRETMGELKKGGVKVIDRRGNVRDVEGNKVKALPSSGGAGGFKL